jgi:sulfotransferase family protein
VNPKGTILSLGKRGLEGYLAGTAPLRMRPDFLLIGAQRSGTTSLYRYLAEHPSVAPALVSKGVHYFTTGYDRGPSWYRGHFPTVAYRDLHRALRRTPLVTGEASPYYLFHPLAPERVALELPDLRLIALLRDPVSRAYSQFQHEREGGFEPLPTFEEAIDAEPARLAGEEARILSDPTYQSFAHQHFTYLSRGRYLEQLRRWWTHMPREQLLVLRAEDLFGDLERTYARVLEFLRLPQRGVQRQTAYNATRSEPMAAETKERVRAIFAPSNRELEGELGWDQRWGGSSLSR